MKHLKRFNESIDSDNMLSDISKYSWVIEDRGYNIIYFVSVGPPVDGSLYTFAIGSSISSLMRDTQSRIPQIMTDKGLVDGSIEKVFLEIVDTIPKKKRWDAIRNEIEKSGLLDEIITEYRLLFPEYKIEKSQGNRPLYIFFEKK